MEVFPLFTESMTNLTYLMLIVLCSKLMTITSDILTGIFRFGKTVLDLYCKWTAF